MCSIERIQYRAHYAKKCKSTDKGLSPRSFQHCLCPPHVSAESVSSRCIGHRWLTAASVAQIQLGEKISGFCHHWPTVPSAVGKKATNLSMESIGHLKRKSKYFSYAHTDNGHQKNWWVLLDYPQTRNKEQEQTTRHSSHATFCKLR